MNPSVPPSLRRAGRALPTLVLAALAAGMLLVSAHAAHAGATAEQKCAAGKNKTAGKYAACRENAEAKLAAGGDPSKYTDALDKCESKFSTKWQKLEDQAAQTSAACPGDDTLIKGQTDAYTDRVAAQVAGNRFKDNLDGTVTDYETGLQWEQKTTAVGSGVNLADPHDVDNTYSWTAGGGGYTVPDGTVFTDFLAKLNGGESTDGVTFTGCFAGHCDWRLPTIVELQTILLDPDPCGTSPCIDSVFGPTVADVYWSATTDATDPPSAWIVYFFDGIVGPNFKGSDNYVRAVRTGS
jgi:hypothetical protein